MKDKRSGWLAELKTGDAIIVSRWCGRTRPQELAVVNSITPTGRINVKHSDGSVLQYNSNGYLLGCEFHRYTLKQATEDNLNELKCSDICDKLSTVIWKGYSLEVLEKVIDVLKGVK